MIKIAANQNFSRVMYFKGFTGLFLIVSLLLESQSIAKTHIYSSLNSYPSTIDAIDEALKKPAPEGMSDAAAEEYVNNIFYTQARTDRRPETWMAGAFADYKRERKIEQDALTEKAKAEKDGTESTRIGTGPYNEHNIVKDNRLRVLGVAQNYCMHNGILMVGTQIPQNCNFNASTLQIPSVAPIPKNYIATPGNNREAITTPILPQHSAFNDGALQAQIGLLDSLGQGKKVVAAAADSGTMALASNAAATASNMDSFTEGKKAIGAYLGGLFGGGKGSMFGGGASGSTESAGIGFESMDAPSPTATGRAGTQNRETAQGIMHQSGARGIKGPSGSKDNKLRGLSNGKAGGGGTVNFDATANSGGPNPLVGGDPEDYFTRINLEDDIFKIVRKRYQTKEKSFLDL